MNKIICSAVAAVFSLSAYSALAATPVPDDASVNIKAMDTNADGMISKDEYMAYHEQSYGKMKQTNGLVSSKDMQSSMNRSSMNNKPIGTTTGKSTNGSTDDTKKDEPINGTTTGTN